MESPILEIRNLAAGYRQGSRKSTVLEQVNLALHRGRLVSLLGANGAGKSTLLRTLSGTQPPFGGEILLDGKPLMSYTPKERSRLVGIVSTDRTQAGGLTVEELVGLGRQPYTGFLGRLDADDRRIVAESIEAVGISRKARSYVAELSDGERQKAMIAKVLAQESPVILLDEPTAFLDVASRIEVLRLLHSLAHRERKAVLLSSHDIAQSLALSDRLWLLRSDRSVVDCQTEDAVLGGLVAELFCSDSLHFDWVSGDFFPRISGSRRIAVAGNSPELVHWCGNAFRRNGWIVDAAASLAVRAEAPGCFRIVSSGKEAVASSVEGLIEKIEALSDY